MKHIKTKIVFLVTSLVLVLGFQNCGGAQFDALNAADLSSTTNQPSSTTDNSFSLQGNEFSKLTIGQMCNLNAYKNLPEERINMALSDNVDIVILKNSLSFLINRKDRIFDIFKRMKEQLKYVEDSTIYKTMRDEWASKLARNVSISPEETGCVIKSKNLKEQVISGVVPLLDLINEQCSDMDISDIEGDIDTETEREIFDLIKKSREFSSEKLLSHKILIVSPKIKYSGYLGYDINLKLKNNSVIVPSMNPDFKASTEKFGFMSVVRYNSGSPSDRCDYDNVKL